MSVLVDKNTKVICQGFTGGQGTLHNAADEHTAVTDTMTTCGDAGTDLMRLGAHTIAKFLQCMPVLAPNLDTLFKCRKRNSAVLSVQNTTSSG